MSSAPRQVCEGLPEPDEDQAAAEQHPEVVHQSRPIWTNSSAISSATVSPVPSSSAAYCSVSSSTVCTVQGSGVQEAASENEGDDTGNTSESTPASRFEVDRSPGEDGESTLPAEDDEPERHDDPDDGGGAVPAREAESATKKTQKAKAKAEHSRLPRANMHVTDPADRAERGGRANSDHQGGVTLIAREGHDTVSGRVVSENRDDAD